jgi:tetratricopeptide (TPR) repeat protein
MHLATATSYNNLGSSLHHKGDYDAAIECYLKCMNISELVLGLNNKDVATAYNNIGLSYHKKQLYNEAILYYEKAL